MQDNSDLIIRDCCEAEVAQFGKPDTICITVDVLREIVQRHSPGPCLQQIQEPAAASAAVAVADEHAAFEIWWGTPHIWSQGHKEAQWNAWQARAALAATPAAGELATLQAGLQAAAPVVLPEPDDYKQEIDSKNCMQCSVAYLLGLPLHMVPDFAAQETAQQSWELFESFIASQGYAAIMLTGIHEFETDYLASGTSPRGIPHMVVMNDGNLVHDPHPSNAGLSDVQCIWLITRRAMLATATGLPAQAVASIYVTEDGQRECDDWKVPLPVGRNLLYAAPQAQADALDALDARSAFREYLSVHDGISLGGHALDAMALDLSRIVEVIGSRVRNNASGQRGEDAAQFCTAAQAAQGGDKQ